MTNTGLVEKQIEQINKHIENYSGKLKNRDNAEHNDDINIISVIGDRGFGKTTILNELVNRNKEHLFIDVIKPMHVNGDESKDFGILEFILANLYKEIKGNDDINPALQRQLFADIERSLNTLFNKGISKLDKLESSLLVLDKINNQTMIKDKIENIFKSVLASFEKELLVIRIDDFDMLLKENLNNSLDDLHKFFTIQNVVIIVAYNESQLIEKYTSQKASDNNLLLDKGLLTEHSIHKQVNAELKKTLLINSKVYLPSILAVYGMNAGKLVPIVDKNITIKDHILNLHKGICPVNAEPYYSFESNELILPNSIREIKQTIELFKEFSDLSHSDNNFTKYRAWFLSNVIQKIENIKYKELIIEFEKVANKPEYIVKQLRKLATEFQGENEIEDASIMRENSRDYSNIALGDLQQILNEYYDFDTSQDGINLIYGLKILISLEMRESLLEYKNSNKYEKLDQYFKIAKGYPTPINRTYFDSDSIPMFNKSEISDTLIKDYEKVMLITNMVTPYNLGEKVYRNSSFILKALNSHLTKPIQLNTRRKESQLNLFIEESKPRTQSRTTLEGYFTDKTNVNQIVSKQYYFLSNPYAFFLTKGYIEWALKYNQLVLWDMFTLDYLYDLKTHRSSELNPWLHVYKRIDSEIENIAKSMESNQHRVYDLNKEPIKKSRVLDWWKYVMLYFNVDFDGDNQKISIMKRGYEDLKRQLAIYTRYEDKFVLSNIKDFSNEEISQYYEIIKEWTVPSEKPSSLKNPDLIITLAKRKKIWENDTFRELFKEKFNYDIANYKQEKEYYSGTEVKAMRSFISKFKGTEDA